MRYACTQKSRETGYDNPLPACYLTSLEDLGNFVREDDGPLGCNDRTGPVAARNAVVMAILSASVVLDKQLAVLTAFIPTKEAALPTPLSSRMRSSDMR